MFFLKNFRSFFWKFSRKVFWKMFSKTWNLFLKSFQLIFFVLKTQKVFENAWKKIEFKNILIFLKIFSKLFFENFSITFWNLWKIFTRSFEFFLKCSFTKPTTEVFISKKSLIWGGGLLWLFSKSEKTSLFGVD